MKGLYLIMLIPALALGEKLPDSASVQGENDPEAMAERFAAPPMDSGEMEALFLESPVKLGNAEERGGMESLRDEDRYRESDLFFREKQQSERLFVPDPPQDEPPRSPPLLAPLREL